MTLSATSSVSPGEMELEKLIRSMQPELHDETYVFATVNAGFDAAALMPIMSFKEKQGTTLILSQANAIQAGIEFEFPCRMITLNIHSSLDAVGFLARITTHLAKLQMGVNPVSGFYHDHLFVPRDKANDAMAALLSMSQSQVGT